MPTTRTICTECRSVVTLPEPAEVGDVVPCPKCEQYFTVPKTKIVPTPGAAKPAQAAPARPMAVPAKPKAALADELPKKKPVVVVEEDDEDEDEEEEEKPKKKTKRSSDDDGPRRNKKKKKRDDDEGGFRNSPLRFIILGVLVVVMLVLAYFLYKKWKEPPLPDIIIPAKEEDYSKPLTPEEIKKKTDEVNKNKGKGPISQKSSLPAVERAKASNDLKQLALAYALYTDMHNRPPATPADLLPFTENNEKLIKAVTDSVYVVAMNVVCNKVPGGASLTVLGYVHDVPEKGGVVAFADGSVRTLTKAEFDAAPKAGK